MIQLCKDWQHSCMESLTASMTIRNRRFRSNYNFNRRSNLHNLVQSRIGPDIFASRIQRLKETKAYTSNERIPLEGEEFYFDTFYQEFIRTNLGNI